MGDRDIDVIPKGKQIALREISDRFGVKETVTELHHLMKAVTKERITADTVNAACNCVQNLNLTIKTAIQAAKFLSEKN